MIDNREPPRWKEFLLRLLMILIIGAAVFFGLKKVLAAPQVLTEGDTVQLGNTIVCDNFDHMKQIMDAWATEGFLIHIETVRRYNAQKNEQGMPLCGPIIGTVPAILLKKVAAYAQLEHPSGKTMDFNVVAVIYHNGINRVPGFAIIQQDLKPAGYGL